MKYYLEVFEIVDNEEQVQIFKEEVSSEEAALNKFSDVEHTFIGLTIIKRVHICKHEEGQSCEVKDLDEI